METPLYIEAGREADIDFSSVAEEYDDIKLLVMVPCNDSYYICFGTSENAQKKKRGSAAFCGGDCRLAPGDCVLSYIGSSASLKVALKKTAAASTNQNAWRQNCLYRNRVPRAQSKRLAGVRAETALTRRRVPPAWRKARRRRRVYLKWNINMKKICGLKRKWLV